MPGATAGDFAGRHDPEAFAAALPFDPDALPAGTTVMLDTSV